MHGLENDTDYEFRVRAKNSAGLSEPSEGTGGVHVKPKFSKYQSDLEVIQF